MALAEIHTERERYHERGLIIGQVGSICVGKSTFAQAFPRIWNDALVYEEKYKLNPYLKEFYKNPKENSFLSEYWFLNDAISQVQLSENGSPRGTRILDPYIYTHKIFKESHVKMGWMNKSESRKYDNLFDRALHIYQVPKADIILSYRNSNLEEQFVNIVIRGREMERTITREYLAALDEAHKEWVLAQIEANVFVYQIDTRGMNEAPYDEEGKPTGKFRATLGMVEDRVAWFAKQLENRAKKEGQRLILPQKIKERMKAIV